METYSIAIQNRGQISTHIWCLGRGISSDVVIRRDDIQHIQTHPKEVKIGSFIHSFKFKSGFTHSNQGFIQNQTLSKDSVFCRIRQKYSLLCTHTIPLRVSPTERDSKQLVIQSLTIQSAWTTKTSSLGQALAIGFRG